MRYALLSVVLLSCSVLQAQTGWLEDATQAHDYVQHRASSYDTSGGNEDYRRIEPGAQLVLPDAAGPGEVTHIWITIAARDPRHLKQLVLRMYRDDEQAPSVETPIGDFFGVGLGDYFLYASMPLQVGSNKALNAGTPEHK